MRISFHIFRGKKYRIKNVRKNKDHYGICDPPNSECKTMEVPIHGKKLNDLSTLIHESLHASFWDLDEVSVDEAAECISKFLWRLGWRNTTK